MEKPIDIIVNGTVKIVPDDAVSFEELLPLAFDPVPSGPLIEWHVGYDGAVGGKPTGTLMAGQSVRVRTGKPTVFRVDYTDRS